MRSHMWPAPKNLEGNLKKLKYFKYYPSFDLSLETNHLTCYLIPSESEDLLALTKQIKSELGNKWGNTIHAFANRPDKAVEITWSDGVYKVLTEGTVAKAVEIENHLEKIAAKKSLKLCTPPPGSIPERQLDDLIKSIKQPKNE